MAITDWPITERPREKLLAHGAAMLSDAELLAIFLRIGVKGKTSVDLARGLLLKFGNLRSLLEANPKDFCQQAGLGIAKYAQLQATLEITKRYLNVILQHGDVLKNISATKQYITAQLRHRRHEIFACLFLDTRFQAICFEELFHGTINSVTVHPRLILKRSLYHEAAAVILAHNHPSGNATPSNLDERLTQKIKTALEFIDVRVLDHIIIGEGDVISFAEHGLLSA